MVKITVTLGKGAARAERTIEIDPDDIPMQFYMDIEAIGDSDRKMTTLMTTYAEVIGFTLEEAGQLSRRDWKSVVTAVNGTADEATDIPNAKT